MLGHLRANVPCVEALRGSAEQIPLADESAEAIVVAQAFHWFDQPPALRELARVLRPGGVIGLVRNARDEVEPWVARLSTLIGSEADWNQDVPESLVESTQFGDVERSIFTSSHRVHPATLVDLVASRSYTATMAPSERERLLAAVGRRLRRVSRRRARAAVPCARPSAPPVS